MGGFASDGFSPEFLGVLGFPTFLRDCPPAVPSFPGRGVDTPMQVPLNFYKVWAPAMRQHAKTLGKELRSPSLNVDEMTEDGRSVRILGGLRGFLGWGSSKKTHYSGGLCLWEDE